MTIMQEPLAHKQSSPAGRRWRWLLPALGIVAWLAIAGLMAGPSSRTAEVQENDNAAFLPKTAEATEVMELNKKFIDSEVVPALLIYGRDTGLTDADKTEINRQVREVSGHFGDTLAGDPRTRIPVYSEDGKAARVVLLFNGTDSRKNVEHVDWLREHVTSTDTGLKAHVGGIAGILTDLMKVFETVDGLLIGVTVAIIMLILLVVYRITQLPLVDQSGAGLA
jgi:putative drug exporter of the RND superfamily